MDPFRRLVACVGAVAVLAAGAHLGRTHTSDVRSLLELLGDAELGFPGFKAIEQKAAGYRIAQSLAPAATERDKERRS